MRTAAGSSVMECEVVVLMEPSEAGRVLGISPSGIRFMADSGRLKIAAKTTTGGRLFDPRHIEKVRRQRERAKAKNGNGGE